MIKNKKAETPSEYISELISDVIPISLSFITLFIIIYIQEFVFPNSFQNISALNILGALYIFKIAFEINDICRRRGVDEDKIYEQYLNQYGLKYLVVYILITIFLFFGILVIEYSFSYNTNYNLNILDFLGIFFIINISKKLAQFIIRKK